MYQRVNVFLMRQYDGIIAPTFYVFVVSIPTLKIPYFMQRCTKTPKKTSPKNAFKNAPKNHSKNTPQTPQKSPQKAPRNTLKKSPQKTI